VKTRMQLAASALLLTASCIILSPPAHAWDAHGHRVVTRVAMDMFLAAAAGEAAGGAPPVLSFLSDEAGRERVAYQSGEADRWRGQPTLALIHENNMDHYLDIEELESFGLSLETLPPLRNEYLRAMVLAKEKHPERFTDYDASKDPAKDREFPGFAPHAIMEHYAKLQASFRTLKLIESLGENDARAIELDQARANVVYHMGMLSHFVADCAQPLHTTRHHHGWVGENPESFTTDYGFHAYIDGEILKIHSIDEEDVAPAAKTRAGELAQLDPEAPWANILAHIRRSNDKVVPLYTMHRDGALVQSPGKQLIEERLADGAVMLASLYLAAWVSSEPNERDMMYYLRAYPSAADQPGQEGRSAGDSMLPR